MKQWPSGRRWLFWAAVLIYVASFALKVFTYDYNGPQIMYGYTAFFMGAFSFLGGAAEEWLIWMANPLFLLSIVLLLYKRNKAARICSLAAVLIGISFSFFHTILAAENGIRGDILSRGPGYFVWVSSLALMAVLTVLTPKKIITT